MAAEEKDNLRQKIGRYRANLTPEERRTKSRRIMECVLTLPQFCQAQSVMLYLEIRDEVETTSLARKTIGMGKRLVVPLCKENRIIPCEIASLEDDLAAGYMGIREPKETCARPVQPEEIEAVLVPGLVFDQEGRRIGYGGGYYDRFLPLLPAGTPIIGLAFECQVLGKISTEEHDQRMSLLVTENGVIYQR